MTKTIGIVGTRRRDTESDFQKVKSTFFQIYNEGDTICSGLCPQGADWFAVLIALQSDYIYGKRRQEIYKLAVNNKLKYIIPVLWFPAHWNIYGKGAGFIRNTDIAKNSNPLIACVANDRKGGTEDTIKKFIKFHNESNLILV